MNIETLTSFFMWCTIINIGLLMFWSLVFVCAPDYVYNKQKRWFPIPRETYNALVYGFLGLFKVMMIVFNLVPFIALNIIA